MSRERIAIFGSRKHPNPEGALRDVIDSLRTGTIIISGGAPGIDLMAREIALVNELEVIEYALAPTGFEIVVRSFRGDRPVLTKRVGVSPKCSTRELAFFRNTWIAVSADRGIAFVDGSEGGTWDTVRQFERLGKPCEIVGKERRP